MITIANQTTSVTDSKTIFEFRGLSTDEKPTQTYVEQPVANGSTFMEMDTGKIFMFNAPELTWIEI